VRTLAYTYDGLQRLTGAVESPGSSYAYQYDVAGNRTQVAVNGTTTQQHSYDAANQVVGWTYDAAGNLTGDGISTYSYDALGRLTAGTSGAQSSTYSYNGDGTLVGQASGGVTTGYAQDLAGGQRVPAAGGDLAITTGSGAGASTADQLWGRDRPASPRAPQRSKRRVRSAHLSRAAGPLNRAATRYRPASCRRPLHSHSLPTRISYGWAGTRWVRTSLSKIL